MRRRVVPAPPNKPLPRAAATASGALVSPLNVGVPPATPGEFAPLEIGPLVVNPPVLLAPMVRRVCPSVLGETVQSSFAPLALLKP